GVAGGVLLQSGLIVRRENESSSGDVVDRFRNRLMVPICRDTGSVIAFGGRQMDADQGGPKYLNSPETPIYSKGRTLYGLNLTKAKMRSVGFAVLVEGYFDFAQVFQSQAAGTVGACGTDLTPQPYLEYLLAQASGGGDFGHDESRRQFLGKMLTVAARIPDAAARDQFADRIAHKARITEEVVRAEIRKAAVNRRTAVTTREVP